MITKFTMTIALLAILLSGTFSFAKIIGEDDAPLGESTLVSEISKSAGNSGCFKFYTSGIPNYEYRVYYYDYINNDMYRIRDAVWGNDGYCAASHFDNGRVVEAREMYKLLVSAGKIRP